METARDAFAGDVAMQMRRRRNADGIDAMGDEFADVVESSAAKFAGHEVAALAVGIGDADQSDPRQFGKHPGVIAAHDAHADNADTQRRARVRFFSLTHDPMSPHALTRSRPQRFPVACRMPTGDRDSWKTGQKAEHDLIQRLTQGADGALRVL